MSARPSIRFAEFTAAWEQREFAELVSRVSTMSGGDPDFPRVEYEDVVSGQGQLNKDICAKQSTKNGIHFDPGDVLFGKLRPYLKNWLLPDFKGVAVGDWWVLRPQDTDSKFIYTLIQSPKYQMVSNLSTGTKMPRSDWGVVSRTSFAVPSDGTEQAQLGLFFVAIDRLIALHRREHDKTVNIKKAMLEKMFPKDGADKPEIRFAGFTDAWEERAVFELADRYDNLRTPITASDRVPGSTPYYGANGIQDYVEGFTHDGEFILIAEDGANDLKNYPVQYINGKVWVNNHAHVLQSKQGIADNRFLMYAVQQTNIEPFLVGGGRAKLNADVMMKIRFHVPALKEQVQIGQLIIAMSDLVTLHRRELEKLQNMKSALLEKMFV